MGQRLTGRVVCVTCGVATTDPWPTDAELATAYGGAYRPESGRFSGPGDAVLAIGRASLARRLDAIAPPGPVLDVGCGDGTLIDALDARGRVTVGLEREATRPRVRAAEIDAVEDGWSAIVFWHSLEHLRAPGRALTAAAARLAPGGVLVVAVPNADSVQARVFGDRWLALDPPRHLTHIPARALRERLAALALRVERESHLRGGQSVFGWLHGMTAHVPGTGDLYDAIRAAPARQTAIGPARRGLTLAAATVLAPIAGTAALAEAAARRGGSVYFEARK